MRTAIQSTAAPRRLPLPPWFFVAQALVFPALAAFACYGYDMTIPKSALCVLSGLAGFNVGMALMTWTCNKILKGN